MRRSGLLALFALLLAVPWIPGNAGAAPTVTTNTATTSDYLNLRSGPSLADRVLVVMPTGSRVVLTGATSNGFYPVTYNGRDGWAAASYLTLDQSTPSPAGAATATDVLNLRTGPGLAHKVLTVMPAGAKVTLTGQSSNGFRSVSYNGWSGWASAQYLAVTGTTPAPAGTALTSDDLNLRSGPSTTYKVLAVMPTGSKVTVKGQSSNGFHAVTFNGLDGWAFSQYIMFDDGPLPEPPPPTPTPRQTTPTPRLVTPTPLPPTPTPTLAPPVPPLPFDVTNPIVGPTRGSAEQAIGFATRAGSDRLDDVILYINEIYRLAPQIGFDPAILVAQSAHETGYWKSKWWRERLNPAGLGITGNPQQEAGSATFANGTLAARAQIAHMHAEVFGSSQPLPDVLQGADQSYQAPFRAGWAGTVRTIHDLAGTWAMDAAYDAKVVRVMKEIFG